MQPNELKVQARRLHAYLTDKLKLSVTYSQALEGIAAQRGDKDWNTTLGTTNPDRTPSEQKISYPFLLALDIPVDKDHPDRDPFAVLRHQAERHPTRITESFYSHPDVGHESCHLGQRMRAGGGWLAVSSWLNFQTQDRLIALAKKCDRENDFYSLNLIDPSYSHTWNPLNLGDADEIASLLMTLVPSIDNNPGADFYRAESTNGLACIIGAVQAAKLSITFPSLAELLFSSDAILRLLSHTPEGPAKAGLSRFLARFNKKDPKTGIVTFDSNKLIQMMGGITSKIQQYSASKSGEIFNTHTPEIDLVDIIRNNKCLYVMTALTSLDVKEQALVRMLSASFKIALNRVSLETPNPALTLTRRPPQLIPGCTPLEGALKA